MKTLTLTNACSLLAEGTLTARQLTEQALENSLRADGEGKRVFRQIAPHSLHEQAVAADLRRANGAPLSALDGIPVSIKDLFDVAGETTLAGSLALQDAPPAREDAAVVSRLRAAGAIIMGKTAMTEFAFSGLGINPHYGTPANPWDRASRRIPGGSSCGAVVSVSDGMALAAVGSDTGGSVRIPAALCGLTGYKPTASRISLAGVLPLSPSLDSVGVIAHDLASCLALDAVIADTPLHPTQKILSHARFIVPQTVVLEDLDPAVATAFAHTLERLRSTGAQISELPFSEFSELAEINASGGFTALESWQWHRNLIAHHAEKYDPRVLSRMQRGEALTDADAIRLREQRQDWQQRVVQRMNGYDAMLMPTVPLIAPTIAELEADTERYFAVNSAMLRNPSIINFLDGCAVSLPCQPPAQAPVGLMLAAPALHDNELLSWALAVEHCLLSPHSPDSGEA